MHSSLLSLIVLMATLISLTTAAAAVKSNGFVSEMEDVFSGSSVY